MNAHKPSLKLAGLYLAIMMAISIFFSIDIYRVSVQVINRDFHDQGVFVAHLMDFGIPPPTEQQFLQNRQQSNHDAKTRLLEQLIFTNIAIFVGAGFLSYYLARRTLEPIEEAHEALSRFTADASHELRTPIAAMQTETEVALMNPKITLEEAKSRLRSNLEELGKLTVLTEGLLRLARLSDNGLEKTDVSIESIIDKAVSRVMPSAEKKRILIKTEDKTKAMIEADEASLVEALVTVLDNAVKYSPEKTEVKIKVKKDANSVSMQIADQGIGIKATELPYIFERFYRADSARSKQTVDGYGLGLAITKNVLEIHNGTISATSKPGKGSIFTISLPLKR